MRAGSGGRGQTGPRSAAGAAGLPFAGFFFSSARPVALGAAAASVVAATRTAITWVRRVVVIALLSAHVTYGWHGAQVRPILKRIAVPNPDGNCAVSVLWQL